MFSKFGWSTLVSVTFDNFMTWWLRTRKHVPKTRRKAYDSLVVLVSRGIWLHRNNKIFNDASLTLDALGHQMALLLDDWCTTSLVDRSSLYRE
jgi:hypothetical protein